MTRERFSLLLDQYQGAPEVTRKRLWLETVQQVLAQNRKIVGGDGRQLLYVPMPGAGAARRRRRAAAAADRPAGADRRTPARHRCRAPERARARGREEASR